MFFSLRRLRHALILVLLLGLQLTAFSQKKKVSFRDSLDGKFDVSNFLIDANGFIPVPSVITEPALGGFGGAIAPVFLSKQPPHANGDGTFTYIPPNITTVAGGATVNGTWFVGGFRSGYIRKLRTKYRILAGYGNVNMSYYKTLPVLGETEFPFNLKIIPVSLQGIKQLGSSKWYMGLKYSFRQTEVALESKEKLPDFVTDKEVKNINSSLAYILEFDSRDNIFTPNKGLKIHFDYDWSTHFLGSDNDYSILTAYAYWFKPLSKNWVSGLRVEGQQAINDPPFYFLPYVSMRGVPNARFQGKSTVLAETEQRWDFSSRWSVVGFGGLGKAFDKENTFSDATTVYSVGTGIRYLMARKFKLRMGLDVAHGNDTWAYYIVFGSNWLR